MNLRKKLIDETYVFLKDIGLVTSEGMFSEEWLGHSECYLRTLRHKQAEPSMGVVAICASRLQKAGEKMISSPRYRQLGMRFIELSEKCHEQVNEEAVEFDLAG